MNISWRHDADRRFIPVVVREGASESDYIAAIRDVATVTNLTGGYAILADLRPLSDMPDFATIMRMARIIEELQSPEPDHLALLACPKGAVYGKARQIVAILTTLGISAELFTAEDDARNWLATRQPLMHGAGPPG